MGDMILTEEVVWAFTTADVGDTTTSVIGYNSYQLQQLPVTAVTRLPVTSYQLPVTSYQFP